MKKNNKGFTLIEMLGVVVLLGILGTVAVTSTTKYLDQSRKRSFLTMSQSIYEAAQNCQTQGKCSEGEYYANTFSKEEKNLLKMGYIKKLKNPISSRADCTAQLKITVVSSSSEYKKYKYEVKLTCPGIYNGKEKTYIWPDQKILEAYK